MLKLLRDFENVHSNDCFVLVSGIEVLIFDSRSCGYYMKQNDFISYFLTYIAALDFDTNLGIFIKDTEDYNEFLKEFLHKHIKVCPLYTSKEKS